LRLWPLSRVNYPKQFLKINNEFSLFQKTILRASNFIKRSDEKILIIGSEIHRFLILNQLRELNFQNVKIILEPQPRNTFSSVCISAFFSNYFNINQSLVFLPCDHFFENDSQFIKSIEVSVKALSSYDLALIGKKPTNLETGYGHIEVEQKSKKIKQVLKFIEKPDKQNAEKLLLKSNIFWNMGVVICKSEKLISIVHKFYPLAYEHLIGAVKDHFREKILNYEIIRPSKEIFLKLKNISFDNALLEVFDNFQINVAMIEYKYDWSDLGTWKLLKNCYKKNDESNVSFNNNININSSNSFIYSEERLVATYGINNLAIIDTKDSLLIADLDKTDNLKEITNLIKDEGKENLNNTKIEYRPWGYYEVLNEGQYFKVKKIIVFPDGQLSLQLHKFRSEHWVVVKGRAKVINDSKVQILYENESTYIPSNTIHQLSNPFPEELILIEIQSGSYLGEDDIERISDLYGR
ncbi:mannose-1-phosphate guanylyltransferase/mannose-6-phosphate isomerase, partial [Alphaproteobacteria bacterium]|nr:mannose-1-phosphate guanylyltransferase/mannose-6-phosphate isomerase [Alphaproteobacteria bacterium]